MRSSGSVAGPWRNDACKRGTPALLASCGTPHTGLAAGAKGLKTGFETDA
jgi:hypothetical protein